MKNFTLLYIFLLTAFCGFAQLASDQNPQYLQSQNKYVAIKDSINQWHATTIQNTYKAYDYMEAKAERKADRKEFRRSLRLERARRNYYYNNFDPYYNNNYPYNNWNGGRYRSWRRW